MSSILLSYLHGLFGYGATTLGGPWPPHSRGF